jgi:TPR repeat protein
MKEALSQGDRFAVICANEFRFVNPNVLQEASLQGDAEALSVMGRCYLDGISYDDFLNKGGQGYASRWLPKLSKFPKDQTKAIELLKSAAEKGSIDACISLGEHFCAQPEQEHLGRLYYLIASYVGHPLAHLNLAIEYLNTKKPIQNVSNEQRERRAIWHLLRAINSNREFMSHYIRGEELRVMCYDHAGNLLDRLIGPSLNDYAKREMQKIAIPWPMKWDKPATQAGAGVLVSAEEWQNQLDDYFRREVPSPNSATQ